MFASCIIAARVLEVLKIQILCPVLTRLHIPAPKFTLSEIIAAAARKHQVNPAFVKSIIAAESGFSQAAVSTKGAIGLMQLMPGTARELGVDANVPAQNVDAGTKYLRDLLIKYEGQEDQVARAVAAYNAGPGAVDKYNGIPPYRETVDYVNRVLKEYEKEQLKKKAGATD